MIKFLRYSSGYQSPQLFVTQVVRISFLFPLCPVRWKKKHTQKKKNCKNRFVKVEQLSI